MTPLTSRPLASVSGWRYKVCVSEKEKRSGKKKTERDGGPWTWGGLYMWREGSLMEEVASHKSQLMSVTLIRSPIHQCTQGPIHPRLFRTCGPQEPWANSHPLTLMLRCVTLWKHPTQMSGWVPRCIHSHTRRLLRAHILSQRAGIDCFSSSDSL